MFRGWNGTIKARMATLARRFVNETEAVTGSEYAFMLALMIVFLIGAVSVLSDTSKAIHEEITNTLVTSVQTHL